MKSISAWKVKQNASCVCIAFNILFAYSLTCRVFDGFLHHQKDGYTWTWYTAHVKTPSLVPTNGIAGSCYTFYGPTHIKRCLA